MLHLEQELKKGESPLDVENLKKLMEELQHFSLEISALEAVFVARHISEFAGIPAAGARVSLPYTVFYELDGDQITVLRAYLSIAALVAQLQPANSMAGDR